MFKSLMVLLLLALSLSVSAGTLTQTQVTGQSYSAGIYQSESVGVRIIKESSFGVDQQTYQNDCGASCNTDNTADFSFSEHVKTVIDSKASAMGVETSRTSFCTTQISTDHLTAGNSNSTTHNSKAGFESNSSAGAVKGHRVEVETSTNGGAEYGEAKIVSDWNSETSAAYVGVFVSSSVVTSQSSFMQ